MDHSLERRCFPNLSASRSRLRLRRFPGRGHEDADQCLRRRDRQDPSSTAFRPQSFDSGSKKIEKEHATLNYFIKKTIITDNLYGVDIMEEATEIARLRLFLTLVAAAAPTPPVDQLEAAAEHRLQHPARQLADRADARVEEQDFDKLKQKNLFLPRTTARCLLEKANRLIESLPPCGRGLYRRPDRCSATISPRKRSAHALDTLDDILLAECFNVKLGIKYEQATWDEKKKT